MNGFVLDASAILAYLEDENGKDVVAPALYTGIISAVNITEVVTKLLDRGLTQKEAEDEISGLLSLGCKVSAFGHDLAILAGQLRPMTKSLGLSLGDRACLALGWQLGLPILTADKQWMQIKMDELTIVSIR